jgi:hypothetical protein
MALPNQPSSAIAVLGNQEFFRIRQPVASPGDIFEIDGSVHAVYLGPLSDVSEVALAYWDRQAQRQMNLGAVSAGGPFVNRVDALLDTQYPGIGQQARILAYPADMIDPAYERPDPVSPVTRTYNVTPYIDLIATLKEIPVIPQVRPDKTYRLKVPVDKSNGLGSGGITDLVVPIYGRRMVTVYIVTPAMTPHVTTVYQVALQPGVASPARELGSITRFSGSAPATDTLIYRASDQHNLDQITQLFEAPGPVTAYNVTGNYGPPLPKCKGLADLLVISSKWDSAPGAGYALLDVYVRVSDREQ